MKFSFPLFVCAVAAVTVAPLGSAKNLRATEDGRRGLRQLTESCTGLIAEVQFENDDDSNGVGGGGPPREETFLSCQTEDGMIYKVRAAGKPFIENDFRKGGFKSGETDLLFDSDAVVDEATAEIFSRSPPGLRKKEKNSPKNRRELYATTSGNISVLVVRVIANGGSTGFSEDQLSNSVFGNGAGGRLTEDPVTLASQYAACSHNKLIITEALPRPATGSGGGSPIENGATTVTVSTTVATDSNGAMVNAITAQLKAQFGVTSETDLAKHLMYCLPAGSMSGIAYAYIDSAISVYSNQWCTYVSGQMHEIGHNLNMAHSNELGSYKDQSGMVRQKNTGQATTAKISSFTTTMGYSYSQSDGPLMCFNGAKLWQFGWYSNRHNAMDSVSNRMYMGRLASILEDPDVEGDPVLIKIDNGSNDYFIHFNRKAEFNAGTREGGNQIMITQAGNGNNYKESELLAKLSAGGTFELTANGETVEVTVNSIDTATGFGYADIHVCFGSCATSAPTTSIPSLDPSSSPSKTPSSSPTKIPTTIPSSSRSKAPSSSPTKAPTGMPSSTPTNPPTRMPSSSPTNVPSSSPTSAPTKMPSSSPTNAPTRMPSSSPTRAATSMPTPSPTSSCGSFDSKNVCRARADCNWIGNPNTGSCISVTPSPPTTPSPTVAPQPVTPSPTAAQGECTSYGSKNTCQRNGCNWSNRFKTCF